MFMIPRVTVKYNNALSPIRKALIAELQYRYRLFINAIRMNAIHYPISSKQYFICDAAMEHKNYAISIISLAYNIGVIDTKAYSEIYPWLFSWDSNTKIYYSGWK